jgi:hypothetical protein
LIGCALVGPGLGDLQDLINVRERDVTVLVRKFSHRMSQNHIYSFVDLSISNDQFDFDFVG